MSTTTIQLPDGTTVAVTNDGYAPTCLVPSEVDRLIELLRDARESDTPVWVATRLRTDQSTLLTVEGAGRVERSVR